MEMNFETYRFVGGLFIGLVAGIAIGVNAWHWICQARDWYVKEQEACA